MRHGRSGWSGGIDPSEFAAFDFETANSSRDSACALAVVRVCDQRVTTSRTWMIRPPTRRFEFTHVHGLTWDDVSAALSVGEVWKEAAQLMSGVRFVAAHNAAFDVSVAAASCAREGIELSLPPVVCTMQLARRELGIWPTRLSDVCRRLRIPLVHHDPLSDARACAAIVVEVLSSTTWRRA